MSTAANYRPHDTLRRHGALLMRLGTALTNAIDEAKCEACKLSVDLSWRSR